MPGGSGFEVLAAVRRWSVTTPVVAMTAAADVPDLDEAGFVRVLRKPIRLEELAALLRNFRGSA